MSAVCFPLSSLGFPLWAFPLSSFTSLFCFLLLLSSFALSFASLFVFIFALPFASFLITAPSLALSISAFFNGVHRTDNHTGRTFTLILVQHRQINFGDVDNTHHDTLDMLATMFDSGKIKVHGDSGLSGVMAYYDLNNAAAAYTQVAGGQVLGKVAMVPGSGGG